MPYISASIIMQLTGAVFPAIARLQQEGDVGQKINQYTRYLTIVISVVQGLLLLVVLSTNPASLVGGVSIRQSMAYTIVDTHSSSPARFS